MVHEGALGGEGGGGRQRGGRQHRGGSDLRVGQGDSVPPVVAKAAVLPLMHAAVQDEARH